MCVFICETDLERTSNVLESIPMCAGVGLCVKPDVNGLKSKCVISMQGLWQLPVLAHPLL